MNNIQQLGSIYCTSDFQLWCVDSREPLDFDAWINQLIQFFVFLGLGKEINWMKLEDAYVEAKKRYALLHAQSVQSL